MYKIIYIWEDNSDLKESGISLIRYHSDLLHYAFDNITHCGKGYASLIARKIEILMNQGYKIEMNKTPFHFKKSLSLRNKQEFSFLNLENRVTKNTA